MIRTKIINHKNCLEIILVILMIAVGSNIKITKMTNRQRLHLIRLLSKILINNLNISQKTKNNWVILNNLNNKIKKCKRQPVLTRSKTILIKKKNLLSHQKIGYLWKKKIRVCKQQFHTNTRSKKQIKLLIKKLL